MIAPLTSRTSDELLATIGKLYWHVPMLAWNVRVLSGDLLSRGAQRQHGARAQRVREIPQPFGASHLAWCFPSSVRYSLEPVPFTDCSIIDTRPAAKESIVFRKWEKAVVPKCV